MPRRLGARRRCPRDLIASQPSALLEVEVRTGSRRGTQSVVIPVTAEVQELIRSGGLSTATLDYVESLSARVFPQASADFWKGVSQQNGAGGGEYPGHVQSPAIVFNTFGSMGQRAYDNSAELVTSLARSLQPGSVPANVEPVLFAAEAFMFALSVAVGLTPEMLPMIVTSTQAKGAVSLSRKKVIVKRLDAIQNFGATDVLCTDKTGALTQDKIALERHTDVFGHESEEVLKFAFLNSHYQTGLKNLLDRAVLEHIELKTELKLEQDYRKIDEVPFDFERRHMSVVVSERDDHHELICMGAVEKMLAVCSRVRIENGDGPHELPLDADMLVRVQQVSRKLNEEGLRVVAVAMKEIPASQTAYSVADEGGLTLIGYVAFLDPPKESAAPALKALADNGIAVKVLTGDNELVTQRVCAQVGLRADVVLLGAQVERMSDSALSHVVEAHQVFAKLTPLHKERIVRALRANGHVVGFVGDGINDAPALRAADIGISVDSAVDIAKEAADIILLKKSLMVLEEGVIEGRKTFSNMLK